jgi:hypothetical protein
MAEPPDSQVPPAGEEIHLPGPTILPLITAAAITVALVGVTTTWLLTIAGGIVAIVCVLRWIGHTRHEISELPLDHERH